MTRALAFLFRAIGMAMFAGARHRIGCRMADVADPRLDFWAERVLSEIAGMDDDAMYEKLGREMREAQAARDAGRGPCQSDYNRIGRRLMEVHERVQRSRAA